MLVKKILQRTHVYLKSTRQSYWRWQEVPQQPVTTNAKLNKNVIKQSYMRNILISKLFFRGEKKEYILLFASKKKEFMHI